MSKKIEVSDETYERIKDQLERGKQEHEPIETIDEFNGRCWFIRTVTYHLVGRCVGWFMGEYDFLMFKDASWVADSGRFMQAIQGGTLSEVEPVGDCLVNVKSIVDAFPWVHPLPSEQK